MNKSEFVAQIAEANNITKKDASNAVEQVLAGLSVALSNGESVSFIGFGKFSVSERAAREGINPSTGEKIQIAATKTPKFTAGATLKQVVK